MRLIDADKLPYVNKVILVDDLDGDIIITIAKEYTSYVNDETPTVEAIPIEWVTRYIDSTLDEDNSQMIGFKAALIKEMVEEWEKENETN